MQYPHGCLPPVHQRPVPPYGARVKLIRVNQILCGAGGKKKLAIKMMTSVSNGVRCCAQQSNYYSKRILRYWYNSVKTILQPLNQYCRDTIHSEVLFSVILFSVIMFSVIRDGLRAASPYSPERKTFFKSYFFLLDGRLLSKYMN